MTLTIEINHKDYSYRYDYEDIGKDESLLINDRISKSLIEEAGLYVGHNNKTHFFGKDIIKNSVITITENEDRNN